MVHAQSNHHGEAIALDLLERNIGSRTVKPMYQELERTTQNVGDLRRQLGGHEDHLLSDARKLPVMALLRRETTLRRHEMARSG